MFLSLSVSKRTLNDDDDNNDKHNNNYWFFSNKILILILKNNRKTEKHIYSHCYKDSLELRRHYIVYIVFGKANSKIIKTLFSLFVSVLSLWQYI